MAAQELVIYGAEGFAVAVADMLERGFGEDRFRVRAFIDDFNGDTGRKIGDAPVIRLMSWRRDMPTLPCLIAIGDPAARRALAAKVQAAGGLFTIGARIQGAISPRISIGEGTFISYPAYVGSFTTIGRHGLIMPMGVVGHDVEIGDFVTICGAASIAGYVVIEDDAFIGTGAVVVNGTRKKRLRIGRGARIAAGAVIVKSVPPGARMAGNPARSLREIVHERAAARRGTAE